MQLTRKRTDGNLRENQPKPLAAHWLLHHLTHRVVSCLRWPHLDPSLREQPYQVHDMFRLLEFERTVLEELLRACVVDRGIGRGF